MSQRLHWIHGRLGILEQVRHVIICIRGGEIEERRGRGGGGGGGGGIEERGQERQKNRE